MRAAAAADADLPEEKEMGLLGGGSARSTSPQGQHGGVGGGGHAQDIGVHGAARRRVYAASRHGEDARFSVEMNRLGDGGHQGGGGGSGFHAAPLPGSPLPPPPPSPLVGSESPPMVQAADDPERQWLVKQLRGLLIGTAPTADAPGTLKPQGSPPHAVKNAALADAPPAHGAYYGNNFHAPGPSVHHDPLFADQAMVAGYAYAPRPAQRFPADVGFPTSPDAGLACGLMYNRTGSATGIGWGQGSVSSDHAESLMLSRQGDAQAQHNWGYASTWPIALAAPGVRVPVTDNWYMQGAFNQMDASRRGDNLIFQGRRGMPFQDNGKGRRFQNYANNRPVELDHNQMLMFQNMNGVKGYIYFMSKDQNGCLSLQQMLEQGKQNVDVIFEGIIDHIAELMTNSFANYLIQKLLDVCDEEQRLRIIAVLTEDPVNLLKISLNTHGTRAVQKLIETVRTRKQIVLIISALQPCFLHLVNDPNGNHVIQKCLTHFGVEENKFIFEASATYCFEMAMHRHGCCVLQHCITNARGHYRSKLITGICAHGFELAQDPFGNYVVQYILDLRNPYINANLASHQFRGNYVYLSKQKVSSNVVEKCLKVFSDNDKIDIVSELISSSHFEQLLQDPFANYVIYTALLHTRGHFHDALVQAIRPHEEALRTSPCCKRISRAISRR